MGTRGIPSRFPPFYRDRPSHLRGPAAGADPDREIFATADLAARQLADQVAALIRHNETVGRTTVVGLGRSGHVVFNEPGSTRESHTRLVTLDQVTRQDAARDCLGEAQVPRHAITMGAGTILVSREIELLAWGLAPPKAQRP